MYVYVVTKSMVGGFILHSRWRASIHIPRPPTSRPREVFLGWVQRLSLLHHGLDLSSGGGGRGAGVACYAYIIIRKCAFGTAGPSIDRHVYINT